MANLNKVMLMGNLTRDPELRHTPSGKSVADLSIAINRVWNNDQGNKQEETTYVDVTFWGRQAELAQQYLTKGRGIYLEGRLQMDTWDDKDSGKKRSRLKVVGDNLQFLPDGKSSPPSGGKGFSSGGGSRSSGGGASAAQPDDFADDEDIPF